MILSTDLNIVGNVNRSDIKGIVPKDAQYANLNPTGEFIQKFYKIGNVKFNDNTNKDVLMYWGEQGGWHNSSFNVTERKDLVKRKFLKII